MYAKLFQNTCHTYETNKDALPYPGMATRISYESRKGQESEENFTFYSFMENKYPSQNKFDLDTVQFKKTKMK